MAIHTNSLLAQKNEELAKMLKEKEKLISDLGIQLKYEKIQSFNAK